MEQEIQHSDTVKQFSGKGGWFYIEIPKEIIPPDIPTQSWGMTKIKAQVGKTKWDTSLLPMGNGEKFVALKADIRKKENINLGDQIKIQITILG